MMMIIVIIIIAIIVIIVADWYCDHHDRACRSPLVL